MLQKNDFFKPRSWKLGHNRELVLGPKSILMGILNVTPDSFSDGGAYSDLDHALKQTEIMISEGAHIVDVGGESTRPDAEPISAQEEQDRAIPVVKAIADRFDILISIDTYRADTAKQATEAGAHVVNDVWGLQKDPEIASVVAETNSGVCVMHTGREREKHNDVMVDQEEWLQQSIKIAKSAGIGDDVVVLDPGFGFAKDVPENLELMLRFAELGALNYPILAGTSRKRFIGALVDRAEGQIDMDSRDNGTAATSALLRMQGAAIFRVHDVKSNRDALSIADGLIEEAMRLEGRA